MTMRSFRILPVIAGMNRDASGASRRHGCGGRLWPRSRAAALSILLVAGGQTLAGAARPREETSRAERLARIYVFYSEPPFAYEPGDEIRIRLLTIWDRDRMEQEIRKEVSREGADVIVLQRSFMEYDGPPTVVGEPVPRGVTPMLQIPNRTAYVVGRLARRVEASPSCECERLYPVGFDTAWTAVQTAAAALGWRVDRVDTDSRYLSITPAVPAVKTMQCDSVDSDGPPAALTVLVRSYAKTSAVRLDVRLVDRTTGKPAPCHSLGVLEEAFFQQLERQHGPGRHP